MSQPPIIVALNNVRSPNLPLEDKGIKGSVEHSGEFTHGQCRTNTGMTTSAISWSHGIKGDVSTTADKQNSMNIKDGKSTAQKILQGSTPLFLLIVI